VVLQVCGVVLQVCGVVLQVCGVVLQVCGVVLQCVVWCYDKHLGLARTIYIRCIYGIFRREITKYTVCIYGSGQPY